jgi:XTP/dITP diphosphohydrolase
VAVVIEPTTLVLASANRAKLVEFGALASDLPVEIIGLAEAVPAGVSIVEDGDTFEANAIKKAKIVADATMTLTLADDSGLEVDALGGRPGVRSARFAHERATDAENNATLLAALADVEEGSRTARFRCVLVLVDPWAPAGSEPIIAHGCCEGTIASEPRGTGGFGYDPLFVVSGKNRTMAELTDAEKNSLSHRARAMHALRPALMAVLESRWKAARTVLRIDPP